MASKFSSDSAGEQCLEMDSWNEDIKADESIRADG